MQQLKQQQRRNKKENNASKVLQFFRLEKSDWKKTERGQLNLSRLAEKFSEGFSSLTWKQNNLLELEKFSD